MKSLVRLLIPILTAALLTAPVSARANTEKEFIMSCTYGVLAGALVGAASLAFEDRPGDNLQRVARGASLGLYMGIGLGIYTIYVLPAKLEREEELHRQRLGVDNNDVQFFPIALNDGAGLGLQLRF